MLMAYTAYRAANVSFVYDESVSYLYFAIQDVRTIFHFPYLSANNHVLNSLFMKWAMLFGPPGDFLLRLPNVLAHAVFMFFCWKLMSGMKDWKIRISSWIIINSNPFIIEFFSMARGYGLAIAFMMGSLYFLKIYLERRDLRWILYEFLALFFAGLAVLSNFAMTGFFFALSVVMFSWIFHRIYRHKIGYKTSAWFLGPLLICGTPLFIYIIPKILELKAAGELYFGGKEGFWHDTVLPLFDLSLHFHPHASYIDLFFKILIFIVGIVPPFLLIKNLIQKKIALIEKHYLVFSIYLILMICAMISIIEHNFFQVPYLTERTALFLLILFGLIVVFLLNFWYSRYRQIIWIVYMLALASVYNFALGANVTGFMIFQDQTKAAMRMLEKDYASGPDKSPKKITTHWAFAPSVDYYIHIDHDTWLTKDPDGKDSTADYFLAGVDEIQKLKNKGYVVMHEFSVARSVLFKKNPSKN